MMAERGDKGVPFPLSKATFTVLDTEFTAWEGSQKRRWSLEWEHREIVQFGIVRVSLLPGPDGAPAQWTVLEHGEILVAPRVNPVLSDYFIDLTGIDNDRIAREGTPFPEAFARFLAAVDGESDILSYGVDGEVIMENLRLWNMDGAMDPRRFRDVRPLLRDLIPWTTSPTSGDLAGLLGLPPGERIHDAVADADSVARAFLELVRLGRIIPQVTTI
jgi:DNA polymerase III epsilon subunit-like protein